MPKKVSSKESLVSSWSTEKTRASRVQHATPLFRLPRMSVFFYFGGEGGDFSPPPSTITQGTSDDHILISFLIVSFSLPLFFSLSLVVSWSFCFFFLISTIFRNKNKPSHDLEFLIFCLFFLLEKNIFNF